ncbi:Hypothetical protein SRAE_X000249000 [Strongyloides ratti]|uniref:Uncharacterized protein n=1 Tax=Strongyloides ratti TaxID=34506 RepID=A0A090L023_STRRB|nr:Hypothetical protein SRAE_X000249000 [Strongyloides ratti]CEF60814.1 Hypothetical protein SRAE_X000249000 [Strongyloides ratti]
MTFTFFIYVTIKSGLLLTICMTAIGNIIYDYKTINKIFYYKYFNFQIIYYYFIILTNIIKKLNHWKKILLVKMNHIFIIVMKAKPLKLT